MHNLKVLHIVDGLHPKRGGITTAVLNIADLFKHSKIEYDILSIGENPDRYPKNVISFSLPEGRRIIPSLSAIHWFRRNCHLYRLIYFHATWNVSILWIYRIVLKKKINYCISPHGSLDPFDIKKKFYVKKFLGKVLVNKILTNAQYIFCTSQKEKENLHYFGRISDNAKVLPLPVDYGEAVNGSKTAFRKRYKIKDDQFVFLFLSRIDYKKGLDNLIEALSQIVDNNIHYSNKVVLVVAGDDTNHYARLIKNMIKTKGIGNMVVFVGLLSGYLKADAFVGSDVFILPSRNENFGLAIIESLQAGTPVLISKNVHIYKELFSTKKVKPGWLCSEDLSNLKSIILETLNDPYYTNKKLEALKTGNKYKTENLIGLYSQYFKPY